MSRRLSTPLSGGALPLFVVSLMVSQQRIDPTSPMPTSTSSSPPIVQGDAHYARREEGHVGDRADSREILEAIAAYQIAIESPDNVEARWKLARALYFRGAYTGLDTDEKRAVFEKARRVSEEAIAVLLRRVPNPGSREDPDRPPAVIAPALRGDSDAAPAFFWAAVSWGEWSLSTGKFAAAKRGAAAKIRDAASTVIALDPGFEEGGGYRILGRLHDQAPKLPLLTWWVSRKEALANLRHSVAVAPKNLVNLHFLAECLARGSTAERAEAIRIAGQIVEAAPSPDHLVEELRIQEEAKRDLAEWSR